MTVYKGNKYEVSKYIVPENSDRIFKVISKRTDYGVRVSSTECVTTLTYHCKSTEGGIERTIVTGSPVLNQAHVFTSRIKAMEQVILNLRGIVERFNQR